MKGFHSIICLMALVSCTNAIRAASISVPNNSFEFPTNTYASPIFDSWEKLPKPDWYQETNGFFWTQLTGSFRNTATNSPDHIDNCDGKQALWVFVVPEVGIFQDYNSVDWDDPSPTHAFDTKFEIGKSYHLAVGVIGGGGAMQEGATLELGLYYRDALSNRVIVAATTVTNSSATFSNTTHLIDFTVNTSTVQAGDAWANQNIGIIIRSTVNTNLQGGYWDLDNVRLTSTLIPTLLNPVHANGNFQFTLASEPGLAFEILASTNATLPAANWSILDTITNLTGTIPFIDTAPNLNQRYYQARQLP
jgi:hypothetical protein